MIGQKAEQCRLGKQNHVFLPCSPSITCLISTPILLPYMFTGCRAPKYNMHQAPNSRIRGRQKLTTTSTCQDFIQIHLIQMSTCGFLDITRTLAGTHQWVGQDGEIEHEQNRQGMGSAEPRFFVFRHETGLLMCD